MGDMAKKVSQRAETEREDAHSRGFAFIHEPHPKGSAKAREYVQRKNEKTGDSADGVYSNDVLK